MPPVGFELPLVLLFIVLPRMTLIEESSKDIPPYCDEFINFINYATTVFHAVQYAIKTLQEVGYQRLEEDEANFLFDSCSLFADVFVQDWTPKLKPGGSYYITRNDSSLIAFHVSSAYVPGEPFAMIGAHIDSLELKLKPVPPPNQKDGYRLPVSSKHGFERLAIAPYSGGGRDQTFDGSYSMWWDRDLGLGGRVLIKKKDGALESRLVSINRPGQSHYDVEQVDLRECSCEGTIVSCTLWRSCFRSFQLRDEFRAYRWLESITFFPIFRPVERSGLESYLKSSFPSPQANRLGFFISL